VIAQKWSGLSGGSTAIQTSTGRTGANFLKSFQARRAFAAGSEHATVVFGCAIKSDTSGAIIRITLMADNLATSHVTFLINPATGTVEVRRGTATGTVLGTSAAVFLIWNQWYHIQAKVVLSDAAGAVQVRWEGNPTPILDLSAVDTKNAGTAAVLSGIDLGSTGSTYAHFDDLWVETGADADFWGDCEVVTRVVNGAGSVTQLTPSAGANYENVDEVPPDTTTYNTGATDGLYDLYAVADLSNTSGVIKDLTVTAYAAKTGTEDKYIRTVVKTESTEYEGASSALSTSWLHHMTRYRNNPNTGVAWTRAQVNAIEIGAKAKDS
jgi:hypothetical protein